MSRVNQRKIRQKLSQIAKNMDIQGVAATYRKIAFILNEYSTKTWTWNYLHQVQRGWLKSSRELAHAIDQLHAKMLVPPSATQYEEITVLAPIGLVPHLTLLNIPTKICYRQACQQCFVPRSSSQKYCSPICRQLAIKAQHHKRTIQNNK